MKPLSLYFLLLLLACSSQANVVGTSSSSRGIANGEQIFPNEHFLNNAEVLGFDVQKALDEKLPAAARGQSGDQEGRFSETLSQISYKYSISPRVLITLLSLFGDQHADIDQMSAELYDDFHHYFTKEVTAPFAATKALQNLLGDLYEDFYQRYQEEWSIDFTTLQLLDSTNGSGSNTVEIGLPFRQGESWHFGSCHRAASSALDFWIEPRRTWDVDYTGDMEVLAGIGGVVTVISSCSLRITHPYGWAVEYIHLDDIRFNDNDHVRQHEVIGIVASNLTQAECCCGYSADWPYIHMHLLKDGAETSIENAVISGWQPECGTDRFNPDTYLVKDGTRAREYRDPVEHETASNQAIFPVSSCSSSDFTDFVSNVYGDFQDYPDHKALVLQEHCSGAMLYSGQGDVVTATINAFRACADAWGGMNCGVYQVDSTVVNSFPKVYLLEFEGENLVLEGSPCTPETFTDWTHDKWDVYTSWEHDHKSIVMHDGCNGLAYYYANGASSSPISTYESAWDSCVSAWGSSNCGVYAID